LAGKKTKMAHMKINKKETYVCPNCNGKLELRKSLPGKTMNLFCTKTTQLERKEHWDKNHTNFSDDCGFVIPFSEKNKVASS